MKILLPLVAAAILAFASPLYAQTASNPGSGSSGASLGPNTYTGPQTMPAATTSAPSLNMPQGVAPTTPANGAKWSTSSGEYGQFGGQTFGPYGKFTITGTPTIGDCASFASATALQDAGAACGSGGSGGAFPNFVTGAWYGMPFTTVTAGNNLSPITIYASIVYFPNAWKVAQLAAYISTAGTSNLQMAVYSTAVSGGAYLPTGAAPLCSTGNIANTATGPVSSACIDSPQPAGFYALETAVADPTMTCNAINTNGNSQSWFAGSASIANLLTGSLNTSQTLSITGQTFGTWPNETSLTWAHNAGARGCAIALQGG